MNKEERLNELRNKLLSTKVGSSSIEEIYESSSIVKVALQEVVKLGPLGELIAESLHVSIDPKGLFVGCRATKKCCVMQPKALTEFRDAIDGVINFHNAVDTLEATPEDLVSLIKDFGEFSSLLKETKREH